MKCLLNKKSPRHRPRRQYTCKEHLVLRLVRISTIAFGSIRPTHHHSSFISPHFITPRKIRVNSYLTQTPPRSQTVNVEWSITTSTGYICSHYPLKPLILRLTGSYIREFTWFGYTYLMANLYTSGYWYGAWLWPTRGPGKCTDKQPLATSAATKTASAGATTFNTNNRPPNDRETILYSYVQFVGNLAVTPVAGTTDPLQENALNSQIESTQTIDHRGRQHGHRCNAGPI